MAERVLDTLKASTCKMRNSKRRQTMMGNSNRRAFAGTVAVVCEGSANASVAEEAKLACAAMGCYAFKLGGTIAKGSTQDSIAPNLIGTPKPLLSCDSKEDS